MSDYIYSKIAQKIFFFKEKDKAEKRNPYLPNINREERLQKIEQTS